jgi:hypothetical protein
LAALLRDNQVMLANKWLQIALGSLAWLLWLVLYISARFGKRDVRQWRTPVTFAAFGAFAVWLGCWITDHREIESVFQFNFFGMLFASNWLTRRYPNATAPYTTLNLSSRDDRGSRVPGE